MIETLQFGWRVHMRCAWGKRDGMKSIRECGYRVELDMDTLVIAKGPGFPIGMLAERLFCPRCRSRRVTVAFTPPANENLARARGGSY
ncbi:hypothetical protein [Mesorhizobium sp. WSM2239]|uniref:Uncharacterized protein n=2 Tax=unclassified Mesorhizobium TaxID=325217 RepID=A0AAU8DFR2_9HYPH